jgi:hypothetical protein
MQTTIATMPIHSIISWVEFAASSRELVSANISTPSRMAMPNTIFRTICTSAIVMGCAIVMEISSPKLRLFEASRGRPL